MSTPDARTASRLAAFLSELQRRRVFRALVGWGLASFAVLQVIEPVMHGLALPDWTLRVAIWGLAAGFPVTAALSWLFDLGPGGITRTDAPPPAGEAAPPGPAGGGRRLAMLLVASALVGAGLAALAVRHASRPAEAGADGRVAVAVADFANETRDPDLDGLSVLVGIELEQSRALRVVTRGAMADVLRQLGTAPSDRIDEGPARAAGAKLGVAALLIGSVRRMGDLLVVELRALDPRKDEYLFTLRERVDGKARVLDAIERLAERTRERLREPAGAAAKVDQVPTVSLEASRYFFEGVKAEDAYHFEEAVTQFRRAVAADPGFALAQYKISYVGRLTGLKEEELDAALGGAVRGKDRLPARERLLVEAWAEFRAGRMAEAQASYERAAEAFPRDKEVLYLLGRFHLRQARWVEARPWFERALALDPTWWPALDAYTDVLWVNGTREQVLEVGNRYLASAPAGVRRLLALAMVCSLTGRTDETVAAAREIIELDDSPDNLRQVGYALARVDQFAELERLMRSVMARTGSPLNRATAGMELATALAYQGRWREALATADELTVSRGAPEWERPMLLYHLLMAYPDPGPCIRAGLEYRRVTRRMYWVAWGMAYVRAFEVAAEVARELPESARPFYEGVAAWRRGERDRALETFRAIDRDRGAQARALAPWYHARVAFEAGLWGEAIAAADEAERLAGDAWSAWGVPVLLLEKSRAYEQLGDRSRAMATLDRLLGWWRRADPDAPYLAEARALRARWAAGR